MQSADNQQPSADAPQFVILLHSTEGSSLARSSHWDFMIQQPGSDPQSALRTWALDSAPEPNKEIRAIELAPHRLEYLDFEGPISGDRGTVRRIDRGPYEIIESTSRGLRLRLFGDILRGTVTLQRSQHESEFLFQLDD